MSSRRAGAPRTTPPDQSARDAAVRDTATNFLVEAGAGAGKTTLLAQRMVSLVELGMHTASIAAVTFTRKAAGELRERFQLALESALRDARSAPDDARAARVATALDDIDDAFLGTIHSFCARLIRERPIEARLDPAFVELDEIEATALREAWWRDWLDRQHQLDEPSLRQLLDVGIEPEWLMDAFAQFARYPDVDMSAPECPAPEVASVRLALDSLVGEGATLLPRDEPTPGWDDLQVAIKRLLFDRSLAGWSTTAGFCDSISRIGSSKVTQNRWLRPGVDDKQAKAAAKALGERFDAFKTSHLDILLAAWCAHRYPLVARVLRRATDEFAAYRRAKGTLGFEDLLLHSAALLESDPDARRALGERFRWLLVDEFQDTDPVQARVLFQLASDPALDAAGGDWTSVTLRAGALFVVGDPRQSIYRFRRADIETYNQARAAIERQGRVLTLEANFRSVPGVAGFVNAHFGDGGVFPSGTTPYQARFARMTPSRGAGPGAAVRIYDLVMPKAKPAGSDIVATDAALVSSWIADRVARGEGKPEDFLILARRRMPLAAYARALTERNVPVAVTGAETAFEGELHELSLVLQLLADPTNPVLAAAALEGVFVGATPADLWAAKEARLSIQVITAPPAGAADDPERVARVRAGLARLHAWLLLSRRVAPDELLETILDESGLLAFTAAGELGDSRAGLLLELVARVRAATMSDAQGARVALAAIDQLIASEVPDASLRPGRSDAVRVMNLHKAKGLEAKVVILAAPLIGGAHLPKVAVRREGARAVGGVLVTYEDRGRTRVLAHPADWETLAAEEARFLAAEEDRQLYVAVTRAADELVVSRLMVTARNGVPTAAGETAWSALTGTLESQATPLTLVATAPAGRPVLDASSARITALAGRAEGVRAAAAVPGFVLTTVTHSARHERAERDEAAPGRTDARSAGAAWGRAVHRMAEWMGRHEDRSGLRDVAKLVARDEALEEPYSAEALWRTAERMTELDEWRALDAAAEREFEWPVAEWRAGADGRMELVEGVIDAAYRTHAGWVVLDWKTDESDAAWGVREPGYRAQVELYAAMLGRATGVGATGKLVRVRRGS